jgi:hypothetical protein
VKTVADVYRRSEGAGTGRVDSERRRWLDTLAEACEAVLARRDAGESTDALFVSLLEDVERLLASIRAELSAADR